MAKANGLELEVLERTPEKPFPAEYAKLNPLNRVPSFEGSDGYVLTECMAIAVYSESLLIEMPWTFQHTILACWQ